VVCLLNHWLYRNYLHAHKRILAHEKRRRSRAKLTLGELEQVIKLVGRNPGCYPPGALTTLKAMRSLSPPSTENLAPNES
jgi:hypothetical protein